MNLKIIDPTYRQVGLSTPAGAALTDLFLLEGEIGGAQLALTVPETAWVNLNDDSHLPWDGLKGKLYRLRAFGAGLAASLSFEGFVQDDDGLLKRDRLLHSQNQELRVGTHVLWLDIKGLEAGSHTLTVALYETTGYEEERKIAETELAVEVADYTLPEKTPFFLDLWQHGSALSRYYDVPLWSKEHFALLENFLKPLAAAGQKVCDLILTDYAWAGQACYRVPKNPSALYEYNIVGVKRQQGQLVLDFSALDYYVSLCEKLGMAQEINLFGLLGNWDYQLFGTPLKDYRDPLRVRVYDVDTGTYGFIEEKEELAAYLTQVFAHLKAQDYWERVKVICDEPDEPEIFAGYEDFLNSCAKESLSFKHACHHSYFLEAYEGNFDSNSVNTQIILDKRGQEKSKIWQRRAEMTWYSCWFPRHLNLFVYSPLMESRLIWPLTYLFKMKGFLRWNYCLWTADPNTDVRYKTERWPAGDMYLVYPGASGHPELSLRFKHLAMGIQDYELLRLAAEKIGTDMVDAEVEKLTGKLSDMADDPKTGDVIIPYHDDFARLQALRRFCVQALME